MGVMYGLTLDLKSLLKRVMYGLTWDLKSLLKRAMYGLTWDLKSLLKTTWTCTACCRGSHLGLDELVEEGHV